MSTPPPVVVGQNLERGLIYRTNASAILKPAGEYGEAAAADLQEHLRP